MTQTSQPRETLARNAASALLKQLAIGSPSEIEPDVIAMALGIVTVERAMTSAEAALYRMPRGQKSLIHVRADVPEEGRRRFAISHEIGHFELHEDQSQGFLCKLQDMLVPYGDNRLEVEANFFASELLMPQRFFARDCDRASPSIGHLCDLASAYRTSLTATAVRFAQTTDESCAIVFSRRGRVKWFRAAKDSSLWVNPRRPLHVNSYAFDCFQGMDVPESMEPVPAESWLDEGFGPGDLLLEQSLFFPTYGVVMTLLWDESGFTSSPEEDF